MFQQENYEVQPKRKLRAGETIQFIFVLITLLNTGYLLYYSNCSLYNVFNYFLFFGSLIWMIFMLLTIAIQFKNKGTQRIFDYADWIFILFFLAMFIWANVLYWHYSNACPKCWDWWMLVFVCFGYVAFICIVCIAFMFGIRYLNKRRYLAKHPDGGNLQHPQDYDVLDGKIDYYDS